MSIAEGQALMEIAQQDMEARRYHVAISRLRSAIVALVGRDAASLIPLSSKNGGGMQSPLYINLYPRLLFGAMRCCVALAKCYHIKGDYVEVRHYSIPELFGSV